MKQWSEKTTRLLAAAALFTFLLMSIGGLNRIYAAGQVVLQDKAGLLTQSEETQLKSQAQRIVDDTGYDVMLLTTDDAGGRSAMDVAEDFYMEHYAQDDGICCLIDMDNREIYIATSGILRRILTDSRIDLILDHAYDQISSGEYDDTFRVMLEDVGKYISAGISQGQYLYDRDTGEISVYKSPKTITLYEILIALAAAVAAAGLFAGITVGRYRLKIGGGYHYDVHANSTLSLRVRDDVFVNQHIHTRHIPKNPPGGGGGKGGFGGGSGRSTIHTGSGGHSFGGGGRKF